MLKSNFLLNLLFLRPIHNTLHSEFVLVFCLSFSLKRRDFVMLHKIFPSNRKTRRNDPIFTWAYFIWVICMLQFYAFPFQESLLQYLNPEISNLQSPDRVFSTVYVLILGQLLVQKILYFLFLPPAVNNHFPDHLQTPNIQIISWWPFNTMRLDIPHYKIFTNAIQNLT